MLNPLSNIELANFMRSIGLSNEEIADAWRLKSMDVSDWKILAKHGITPKSYHKWVTHYSSIVGKSVMVRKRGLLVSMKCTECGGQVRWDIKRDRICEKCGLIVDSATQAAERVRFALRTLDKPIRTKHQKEKIKNLLNLGRSEEDVIRIMLS